MGEEKVKRVEWAFTRPTTKGERIYGSMDQWLMWFAAGVVISTPLTGGLATGLPVLAPAIPLSFVCWYGNFVMMLVGFITFKFGVTNYVAGRRAYGIVASSIGAIFNIVGIIGWDAICQLIAAEGAAAVAKATGAHPFFTELHFWAFLMALIVGIIVYIGPVGLLWMERIGGWSLVGLGVIITWSLFWGPAAFMPWGIALYEENPYTWLTYPQFLELLIAYQAFSFLPFFGDYTRYSKTRKSCIWAPIGLGCANSWYFIIGALSAKVTGQYDPSFFIARYGLGWFSVALMYVGTITTNAICLYSASMSVMNFPSKKAVFTKRTWITLLVIISALYCGLMYWEGLMTYYQWFLLYIIGIAFSSYFGPLVGDYLYFRFTVDTEQLYRKGGWYWYKAGLNWRGILCCALGMAIQYIYGMFYYGYITFFGLSVPTFLGMAGLYMLLTHTFPPRYLKEIRAAAAVKVVTGPKASTKPSPKVQVTPSAEQELQKLEEKLSTLKQSILSLKQ